MSKKIIFLVTFNMYKGGSLSIYEEIKKFIYKNENLINITFGKKFKVDFNSKIELKYPAKRLNIIYRLMIEQIFLFLIALIKRPKRIILLGNFPCIFWIGEQKILFHNLLYIESLRNPRKYGMKLFFESKFWEICIKIVKPKILVQTDFIKETLENLFNFNLDIEILGAPIINSNSICDISDELVSKNKIRSNIKKNIDNNFLHLFYPATFYQHKNHKFLLSCSEIFLRNKIKVHLTIDDKLLTKNYYKEAFIFHKKLSKKDIIYLYQNTNALIYSSLVESLGMPLLEVTQYQKSVIAINLPYVHSAITDLYIFEQNKISLEKTLKKFKYDFFHGKHKIAKTKINLDSRLFFENLIK